MRELQRVVRRQTKELMRAQRQAGRKCGKQKTMRAVAAAVKMGEMGSLNGSN